MLNDSVRSKRLSKEFCLRKGNLQIKRYGKAKDAKTILMHNCMLYRLVPPVDPLIASLELMI